MKTVAVLVRFFADIEGNFHFLGARFGYWEGNAGREACCMSMDDTWADIDPSALVRMGVGTYRVDSRVLDLLCF